MSQQARFAFELRSGIPLISASGELDMSNVHGLEVHFTAAADQNSGVVVVSLADVRYFDSRTIHSLGMLAARLGRNRQRLAIVLPGMPSARMIFEMSGLQSKLAVFDTLDDALAYAYANRTELR